MHRIIYISGRYRHWTDEYGPTGDRILDVEAMAGEVEDERRWMKLIAQCGHAWIAPLHNSVPVDGAIPDQEFIARDLAIITRLRPNWDCILMRPSWDDLPESQGARAEYDKAVECDLIVIWARHGADAVRDYLRGELAGIPG